MAKASAAIVPVDNDVVDGDIINPNSLLQGVFGSKPQNAIYLPNAPYGVRFNCQTGQLAENETTMLGNRAEISIIQATRYWGTLGKTSDVDWLQIFYIPAPKNRSELPENTVCVSYLKTRSLSSFDTLITRLVGADVNPAEGIFELAFTPHSGTYGNYFSVTADWRPRTQDEMPQLDLILAFMSNDPKLDDAQAVSKMVKTDGLTATQVSQAKAELRARLADKKAS